MGNKTAIICFIIGLALGCIGTGYTVNRIAVGKIADINQRYDSLNREYTERQRIIEANLGECIGLVENARGIVERTGASAGRAVANLREAAELIKQGIEENKILKMELDNIRAGLLGLGGLAGLEIGE